MNKATAPAIPAESVVPAAAPTTPAHGGSYTLDEASGTHTLVEQTQPSAGRAGAAVTTKN